MPKKGLPIKHVITIKVSAKDKATMKKLLELLNTDHTDRGGGEEGWGGRPHTGKNLESELYSAVGEMWNDNESGGEFSDGEEEGYNIKVTYPKTSYWPKKK